MIHLRARSEFSFKHAFGKIAKVVEIGTIEGQGALAITDSTTFGHLAFGKACAAANVQPIYGAEILVVYDAGERVRQNGCSMAFLARNEEGLAELYGLVTLANSEEHFYYTPRIDYNDVNKLSANLFVLTGHGCDVARLKWRPTVYLEFNPANPVWNRKIAKDFPRWDKVVCSDNLYTTVEDKPAYEILSGRNRNIRTTIGHLATEAELRAAIPVAGNDDFLNTERVALECKAMSLPKAQMIEVADDHSLLDRCLEGALERKLAFPQAAEMAGLCPVAFHDFKYAARLYDELKLIEAKKFENYFRLVGDMVRYAKERMFVGPARGSAAGSLVSYLLGITDVDPIKHSLLFERFIDINRSDYPDIDVDFADDKRGEVFEYLAQRYGAERVARVGNILRYKPRSAFNEVTRQLAIPTIEVAAVKDAVEERDLGDERLYNCIEDALKETKLGQALVEKYPAITVACQLEGHATTHGTHAGGVVVTQEPVTRYCSIGREGVAQVDYRDAEKLGMVKIDVLGLTTLGTLGDALSQLGQPRQWLVDYPLDDPKAFEVMNSDRMTGIFQFEGDTQRQLTKGMGIETFNDIAALNALSRPGPLASGTTAEFIQRRKGETPVEYLHPLLEPFTKETLGSVIYQEQVMQICREIGKMSWPDVINLRKAMGKTLGQESFGKYWEMFKVGAVESGMTESEARRLWDRLVTFGSYAFNKSHAVAYAYISYWCAVLKAHHPLQFAAALLKKAGDDQSVNLLRELVREGYEYVPVDPARSGVNWTVVDGKLLGGLTNIKGLGEKKANDIIQRRIDGRALQPGQIALLANPKTPFDDIFATRRKWSAIYDNPEAHNIKSGKVVEIKDITEIGEYLFIGKIVEKTIRDLNEPDALAKRQGRRILRNHHWLALSVADDTGEIKLRIGARDYAKLGKKIADGAAVGDWWIFRAVWRDENYRNLDIRASRPCEALVKQ
jgi:DNA polymerase III alpha subunit